MPDFSKLLRSHLWFFVIITFLIFSALRFYNIDKRVIFDWDQEQYSTQIKDIVQKHDFTLLGPRANNDRGFFLGPYFTYILLPFYLASNLNPAVLAHFLIFFNIVFFWISYCLIKQMFSSKHAVFFLLLWAINPLLQNFDTIPWWPLYIPIGTILTWYFLYLIEKKGQLKDWFFLGIVLGFFINMHFQFIFIILFALVFLAFLFAKKRFHFKKPALALAGFALMFTPLLLFDLRHNFLNFRLFSDFFTNASPNLARDLPSWQPILTNLVAPYTLVKSPFFLLFFYLFLIFAIFSIYKKSTGYHALFYKSAIFLWILVPISFIIYGQPPSEYYFLFLYPFITLIIVNFFLIFKKNVFLCILAIFLTITNMHTLISNLDEEPLGLYWKGKVVKELKARLNDKVFSISFDGAPSTDTGFRYLFFVYGLKPTTDTKVPHVRVLQPYKDKNTKFGVYGLEIPKELKP